LLKHHARLFSLAKCALIVRSPTPTSLNLSPNILPEFLPYYFFTHRAHSINSAFFSTRYTLVVSSLIRVLAIEHFEKTYSVIWRCITLPIFARFYPYSSKSHHTTRVWGDSSITPVSSYTSLGMHQFYSRLYSSKYRPIFAECTPLLVSQSRSSLLCMSYDNQISILPSQCYLIANSFLVKKVERQSHFGRVDDVLFLLHLHCEDMQAQHFVTVTKFIFKPTNMYSKIQ
jgi:hypothetical protein